MRDYLTMKGHEMDAVQLRFCEEYGINENQFRELRKYINLAVEAQMREHNCLAMNSDKEVNTATQYATTLGIYLRWDDGFYPSCVKGPLDRTLPE